MARKAIQKPPYLREEIDVNVFKNIHIRFPGDTYLLAVWLAMADLSKTTLTLIPHTTLYGLACHFEMLYGDYSMQLTSEKVLAEFRRHGITGNPNLRLESLSDEGHSLLEMEKPTYQRSEPMTTRSEQSVIRKRRSRKDSNG